MARWDAGTTVIEANWDGLVASGFDWEVTLYGQWPGTVRTHLLYLLETEIHHRAQAFTCLRALGVEPPAFWER